jgi:hypothetical protein
LFDGVRHDPDAYVLFDPTAFTGNFDDTARSTYAVANALLVEGICFGFITPAQLEYARDRAQGRTVLVPPGIEPPRASGVRIAGVSADRIQPLDRGSTIARSGWFRALADPALRRLAHAYFTSMRLRRAFDAAGITARFLRSAYFTLPSNPTRVLELLALPRPVARPEGPALVERWIRADESALIHVVNYADAPVRIMLPAEWGLPRLHSPDPGSRLATEPTLALHLEAYAVLELDPPSMGADRD